MRRREFIGLPGVVRHRSAESGALAGAYATPAGVFLGDRGNPFHRMQLMRRVPLRVPPYGPRDVGGPRRRWTVGGLSHYVLP